MAAAEANAVIEAGRLLSKCKDVSQTLKAARPSKRHVLTGVEVPLSMPSRKTADQMVSLYLHYFESAHRILHKPTFMTMYESYWSHDRAPSDTCLVVALVVGIGFSVSNQEKVSDLNSNTVHSWIHAAHVWLAGPLDKDRLTIRGLQVYCLAFLARTLFSYSTDLQWPTAGSLVHFAMHMGLHRDPKHLPAMSVLDAEVRRRLWATAIEFALQASLDVAMPSRISVDEFDTEPPANVDDADLNNAVLPRDGITDASAQRLLLRSVPVRIQALRHMFGLKAELSYPEAIQLGTKIVDACRECDTLFKNDQSQRVTVFCRNYVQYLLRRFIIPLHGPFAMELSAQPLFGHSLQACIDSAMILLYPEPDETFSRLLVTAGGLFREAFRQITMVFSLALLMQVESQLLDNTLQRMPWQVDAFTKAVDDLIERGTERTQHGDVIIKTHMVLTMVRARADAMKTGGSSEARMATAARDSLRLTHGILSDMAAVVSEGRTTEMPDFAAGFDSGLGSEGDFMDAFLSQSFFDL